MTTTTLPVLANHDDPMLRLAVAAHLARYKGETRVHTASDLNSYLRWCLDRPTNPLEAGRAHVELYLRWLQEVRRLKPSTVSRRLSVLAMFYRTCVIDGVLEHSPAEYVRHPQVPPESPTLGLSHLQFEAMITAGRESTNLNDYALVAMLGLLGLRVFEATGSGFPTRKAAREARDTARHSVNSGTYVAPQDLTVAAWLDRWIDGHTVELKPSTAASYRDKIDLYLKPTIGHERVQALSPGRLSVVWRDLQAGGGKNGKPLSRRSVEYARAVLRKALEDAVVERVIQLNPVTGSKVAKRDGKPQHTTWTGQQLRTFLEHAGEDRWLPLWTLFAATGMRRGEVAGLRWADANGPIVDLDAGTIRVEVSTPDPEREGDDDAEEPRAPDHRDRHRHRRCAAGLEGPAGG